MTHPDDIPAMEKALKERGISIDRLCTEASINKSTWTRWKNGVVSPTFRSWDEVVTAYRALVAPKTKEAVQ